MAGPALSIDIEGRSDKFKKSMDDIGSQADKTVSEIEAKFADFDPQLNTASYLKSIGSIAANFGIAGVAAGLVLDLVVNINKNLAELASTADRVGLSFKRFQELKFAANVNGVSDSDFSSSLDKLASNLQNSKFKATDLQRVFESNGLTLKDNAGNVKDINTLFSQTADIIRRAPSIQDAIQIGGMVGLTQQFSQKLFEAGDSFMKLAADAKAAGAIIDDNTVQKAVEFDSEWAKASTEWNVKLKAAIGGILPLLDDAVSGALSVLNAVRSVYDLLRTGKDLIFEPDYAGMSSEDLKERIRDFQEIRNQMEKAGAGPDSLSLRQRTALHTINPDDPSLTPTLDQLDAHIAKLKTYQASAEAAAKTRVEINKNPSVNPGPNTGTSESRDVFERQVDQITKRTAQINADTTATFANHAVQQQLRAEYELLNAIVRDNGEVTQAQIDKYEELRKTMSAQQSLEGAGITLTKEHGDAFFSASTKIGSATANFDAARNSLLKINDASQQFGSALSSAFADAVVEGKNLNDVLSSLVKTLEKSVINSAFGSIFNAPTAGGLSPAASLFSGLFTPGAGHNAGGTGSWRGGDTWVGENGPELIRVPRGSQIAPNSAVGGGGAPVEVNIHHDGNTTSTVSQSTNSQGGPRIDVMVSNMITSALKDRGHPITRGIAQTFSLNRANGIS